MRLPVPSLLSLAGAALALPSLEQRDDPQTVHLTFHGGPASYSMEFPADGVVRETGKTSRPPLPHLSSVPPPLFSRPPPSAPPSPRTDEGSSLKGTDDDIAISVIDAPDYFAQSHCTFKTDGEVAFQSSVGPDGTQQILVGPPQPIRSVSCEGVCLPTYGAFSLPGPSCLTNPRALGGRTRADQR